MKSKNVKKKIKQMIKKLFKKTSTNDIKKAKKLLKLNNGNKFIGELPVMNNSRIVFNGKNNILVCEKNVKLNDSVIKFECNNSLVYLSSNARNNYYLKIDIRNNSMLYIGKNCYFNGEMKMIFSEGKNIVIGDNCLFSHSIFIRLADPHLIYDISTHKRINLSESVYIGDHVWIGQDVLLLKGTKIGSGTVVGANSICSRKILYSNSIYAGNKLSLIKENIFWNGKCVHRWIEKDTDKYMYDYSTEYIFSKNNIDYYTFFEKKIDSLKSAYDKYKFVKKEMGTYNKNRFSIFK